MDCKYTADMTSRESRECRKGWREARTWVSCEGLTARLRGASVYGQLCESTGLLCANRTGKHAALRVRVECAREGPCEVGRHSGHSASAGLLRERHVRVRDKEIPPPLHHNNANGKLWWSKGWVYLHGRPWSPFNQVSRCSALRLSRGVSIHRKNSFTITFRIPARGCTSAGADMRNVEYDF
jgi:hypothetical protein